MSTVVEAEQIASQWLVINSDPSGADIFIDDQPANQTPYQNELPIGKHTYRLSRDLYLPTAGVVELTATAPPQASAASTWDSAWFWSLSPLQFIWATLSSGGSLPVE